MKQFTKRNGEGAVCVTASTPSTCKGQHLYNAHDTKKEKIQQEIEEILSFSGEGCKAEHVLLSQLVIQKSPQSVRESVPFLFGTVLYAGYVLGVRAERERRRK